jgi:hypothetical protein
MTGMRTAHRLLLLAGLAALVAAGVSCGDVVRSSRAPVYLVIDSLQGARSPGTTFSTFLLSDVLTLVTSGGTCSTVNPCPTYFNDVGQVTMHLAPKDITALAPSTNNQVTITSYHVAYCRADRVNSDGSCNAKQGVDVPYAFDGAITVTVPVSGPVTVGFELVRNDAKIEPPLIQLVTTGTFLTVLANVTFYGADLVGNAVSVMGTIQIDFGNFADP